MNKPFALWNRGSLRRIFIDQLAVSCSVGIYEHEHTKPQTLLISLKIDLGHATPETKIIFTPKGFPPNPAIFCYDAVARMVRHLALLGHLDFIETLAEDIAQALFQDGRVEHVEIILDKPQALNDTLSSGIEFHLSRSDMV